MKRVVITGLGILSPLGRGVTSNWQGLLSGKSAISKLTRFDPTDFTCKIAGQIKQGDEAGDFNPDEIMDLKDRRRVDDFILYAMCAGKDAVEDAGLESLSDEEKERVVSPWLQR